IEEVWRGHLRPGPTRALWADDDDVRGLCGNMTDAEWTQFRQYMARPLSGPPVGQKLLLAGSSRLDGQWVVSYVRIPYSNRIWDRVRREVQQLSAIRDAQISASRQLVLRELAQDRELRAKASIPALCASATDVCLGRVSSRQPLGIVPGGANQILVANRLWSRPQDPRGLAADLAHEYPQRKALAEDLLYVSPRESRMIRS